MLSDLSTSPGLEVVTSDERRLAYRRLKIPTAAVLSRATSMRVAAAAGANLLLAGSYEVTGSIGEERVQVLCRLIDITHGRMAGSEINVGGPLKDLSELQGTVAYEVLYSCDCSLPISRQRLSTQAAAFPTAALEYYTKGIMTEDLPSRARLLRLAIGKFGKNPAGPAFIRTGYRLARTLHDAGKYGEAIPLFRSVPPGSVWNREARFYLALALCQTNHLDEALATLQTLERELPVAEVTNNLAVVETRKNLLAQALPRFSQAVAGTPEDSDIRFNYAYALWLTGDDENAATQLRQVLRRRTSDGEAHYLLSKVLQRSGQAEAARAPLIQARRFLSTYTQWETGGKVPGLTRLKQTLELTALHGVSRVPVSGGTARSKTDLPHEVDTMYVSAQQSFRANLDDEARNTLQKVIQLAPDHAGAHYLMGRIYERWGDHRSSVNELRAATFWDPEHTDAYLLLARIYLSRQELPEAGACIDQVLRRDPANSEALRLRAVLAEMATQP
ncbi:MAG: tetratricopeptide repeat protein [Acidobacteria bacterium]|nr:tetratricopeptide repeat protein [Acidobacteriota bacterium]